MKIKIAALIGSLVLCCADRGAEAQSWPERPVKIVVPFAPGGPSDAMARVTAQHLGAALGQSFIVENQAGAGGAIAGEVVVRAPADGYTLYWVTPGQVTILPQIVKLSYDPMKDLRPISIVAENKFGLVVNPKSLPVKTIAEFIDRVRSQPGYYLYAYAGPGTLTHLAMELFAHRLKLSMVGIAYKGIAPAFTDVVAGHVPTMFASLADAIQQDKAGAIRLLAVSADERSNETPDVPTIAETGIPGFNIVSWNGLMAPSRTPDAIVNRIAEQITNATKVSEFRGRLAKLGFDPVGDMPHEFAAVILAEVPMWSDTIKSAHLQQH